MASDEMGPKGPAARFRSRTRRLGDLATRPRATVIEISGVIKWFDVSKGYGFIVPDNGMADVLLHVTCLRRDGFQTAYEGARVVCEALQRPKGLQAFRILSHGRIRPRSIRRRCRRRAPMSRDADQRARARHGQVVQPLARLRLSHPRRRHAGHLRPHGDAAPLSASPSCGPARPCWCASAPARRA